MNWGWLWSLNIVGLWLFSCYNVGYVLQIKAGFWCYIMGCEVAECAVGFWASSAKLKAL